MAGDRVLRARSSSGFETGNMKTKQLLAIVTITAVLATGQPIFGQTVIINDDFSGIAINSNVWTVIIPYCDSQMYETNGNAVFVNGGQLLSKTSLPTQISVSGSFALTGNQYDQFCVFLRTDGAKLNGPNQTFYTGIEISFQYSQDPASGNPPGVNNVAMNGVGTNYPLAMNTYYPFTILDDGTNVTLYLGDLNTPFMTVSTTNRAGNLLGLQNRMGACAGSSISAGSVTQLDYLSVSTATPAPTITAQPTSTTNNIGDNVSFSVVSTNTGPLTYQWYFDNNSVNGATNSSLSITNVQQENVGQYYVVVSDSGGSTTSGVANLTIAGVPCWINDGLVAYYPFNGNANDASGNGNNGTIQGGVNNGVDRFGNSNQAYAFNGLNGCVTIPNSSSLTLNNSCSFTCWVFFNEIDRFTSGYDWQALFTKDNYGSLGLMFNNEADILRDYASGSTIDTVWATVSAQTWYQVVVTVTNQMEICYINGESAGSGTLSGSFAGNTNTLVLGENNPTGPSLEGPIYPLDGSLDDVRIYNRALSSNEVAQLYTFETSPVAITNQPESVTNDPGDTVVLSVGTSGGNPQDYTWYFSGTNVDNGTNSILTIPNISQPYFGNYYVVVTNAFSSVTSSVATIFEPATITVQPTNVVVSLQSPATFTAQAVGYPAPNYQWTLNGTNVVNGTSLTKPNITGANSNTLTIPNVSLSNTGNYQVLVSNSINTVTSSVATLNMFPSITSPFMGGTPIWGTSTSLSVGAIGSGTLTYQWYFNGQPIDDAVYPQLNFASIQFTNNGFYSVVVSSPYGSVTNVAEQVAVNPAVVTLGFYPGLTINGATGDSYMIQSSSNLANTNNWTTLTNLTLTQPVQTWVDMSVDASSPLNNQYFYRLVPQ